MPFSRTKPRIRLSGSVLAQTTKTSAIGELVIHILEPESRKPPSTLRARVFMPPGSEPWSGSVRPKQPMSSPVASPGRKRWRWASEPYAWIGCMTRLDCTLMAER